MEFIVGLGLVAVIVLWVWNRAESFKRAQDEIDRLTQTVAGQDAALKLKREQERLRIQKEAQVELEIAAKIRRSRDARAAAEFLRGPEPDSGPGVDPVRGTPTDPKTKP